MKACSDGLKPCPMCGQELDLRNVFFCMDDGEIIEELASPVDLEHILNPDNAFPKDDRSECDEEEQLLAIKVLNECVDAVEFIGISCPCGFHYYTNKYNTIFPKVGWLTQFKALANRRVEQ